MVEVYTKSDVDALVSGINVSIASSISGIAGANAAITNTNTSLANLTSIVNDLKTRVTKLETTTPPPPVSNIYDSYPTIYNFGANGTLSSNGLWRTGYHGSNPVDPTDVGKSGVRVSAVDGKNVMFEYPYTKPNTTPKWPTTGYKTSSSLIVSEKSYTDFDATISMRTIKSLRTPSPSRWEAAWFGWHFNDAGYLITDKGAHFHHYYIIIYVDGNLEFGRKDNLTQSEHQYFLPTIVPRVNFAYGKLNKIRVKSVSNHIQIWIDDILVVDLIDDGTKGSPATDTAMGPVPHPPTNYMYSGRFWLYNEDAEGEWLQLTVTPL